MWLRGVVLLAIAGCMKAGTSPAPDSPPVVATPTACRGANRPVALDLGFGGLVLTPDGTRIYAARTFHKDIVVLSTKTLEIIWDPIAVGGAPNGLAIHPSGSHVAVAVDSSPGKVVVVDSDPKSASFHSARTTTLDSNGATSVGYRPDGAELYALTQRPNTGFVYALDPATGSTLARIANTASDATIPSGVAFSPDSSKAYAAIFQSEPRHNVAVVSTARHALGPYVNLGQGPTGGTPIAAVTAGKRIWILGHDDVAIVDPATDTVVTTLKGVGAGGSSGGICASPDGSKVLVTRKGSLHVHDGATGAPTHLLDSAINAYACAFSTDGCFIYVTDRDDGSLHEFPVASLSRL
jgi:serine/threonine-protein kinase